MRAPGAFVEFCRDMLVIFVAGVPRRRMEKEPVRCFWGPITVPAATPVATPALSPFESGIVVAMLWAGVAMKRMPGAAGIPVGPAVILG
jgi:hypothetical protein